ncbi:MAG: glycosyltransferase [Polyangia bacterium]|jgi:rhamnosyl/mannosyltransferase|nr:glycosyltransferase [Polyangia bacterium]
MRILHLYKAYPPVKGGIENTVQLLAEAQAAEGHDVTVIVSAPGPLGQRTRVNGVELMRLGRLAELASTPLSPGLPLALMGRRADIAHLHAPFPPAEVANWLFGRSRRTVITWHSDVVRQKRILRFYAPVLRMLLLRADRIFPTSASYLRRSPFLAEVSSRCQVIPLGIRLDPFLSPDPDGARRLRLAWGTARDGRPRPVLLFVGLLRAYKGLGYLLDAMRRLDARLVIVGDGPEAGHLREEARDLGVADKVVFAGRLEDRDLPAAYQAADLFALPSHLPSEAFGLVLIEAMASALPVVCAELGTGTTEVARSGETALVVPPADSEALAKALGRLLEDEALRRRLGEAGRRRALAEYAAPVYVRRTMEAYEELLGGARRPAGIS